MQDQENKRLLFDRECKDCNNKSIYEWADSKQSCRAITDKLRIELRNNKKRRKIVAKIKITLEYIYNNHKVIKMIDNKGAFILKDQFIFGKPFQRAEIQGKYNGGTFLTEHFGWNKK